MTDPNPVTLAGRELGKHRHVCAFFNHPDQQFDTLLPFIEEGISRGEKAFHIVDPGGREDYVRRLEARGIDVGQTEASGQLEVRYWEQLYLRERRFDQTAMLSLIEEVLQTGKRQGYPRTRFVAHMEWALEELPGVADLVEYEARLNYILPKYDDPVICTYDTTRFSAGVVLEILRIHPLVIVGGILQVNPFYVEPDAYIAELRARGAGA